MLKHNIICLSALLLMVVLWSCFPPHSVPKSGDYAIQSDDKQEVFIVPRQDDTETVLAHCQYCTNMVRSVSTVMAYCTNISIYEASNGPVVEFSVKSQGAFKNAPTVTQSNGAWIVRFTDPDFQRHATQEGQSAIK